MKFLEHTHIVHGQLAAAIAAAEDMYNGGISGDVVSMENAESAVFFVVQLAGATGSASIQIFACDDTTPSNTSAISFKYKRITSGDTQGATTETKLLRTTAGADQAYAIEVEAAKLAEITSFDAKYIQFDATEAANDPVDGLVFGPVLMGLRSAEDALGTQLT